jgi:hypothetical protein
MRSAKLTAAVDRNQTVCRGATVVVVLKGSKARGQVTDSFKDKGFHALRKQLEAEGILKSAGDQLIFIQDYLFKSPSAAAAIVVGNNMNGWLSWKNLAGTTLDAAVRQMTQD